MCHPCTWNHSDSLSWHRYMKRLSMRHHELVCASTEMVPLSVEFMSFWGQEGESNEMK